METEYFYIVILLATNYIKNRICCKYGMTTQNPFKYIKGSYRGHNRVIATLLILPVYNGKNEENKFRHYLENIYKNEIYFHGDHRNEYFDIKINDGINIDLFRKNYIKFSHQYDNNIKN